MSGKATQNDRTRDTRSRKHVDAAGGSSSFTFIKPPTPPDRAAWEKKVQIKRRDIEEAQAKLKELQEILSNKAVDPERQLYYEKQKKATQRLQEVQATIREEREKRANISKTMRDVREMREELESKLHELTGQLGTFKSIEELEQALSFITIKMETEGTGSLKQEKEYIRRKKLLEAAKEQITKLKPLRENIEKCSDKELESVKEAKALQKHLDELNGELRAVIQEKNSTVMPTSKIREEQAAARKERDELRVTMAKTWGEIDALYKERRKEVEEYQVKREAWQLEIEASKKAAAEAAKLQEDERIRRQKEKEAERKLNPYAKEIEMCTNLIWYLENRHSSPRPVTVPRVVTAPVARANAPAPGKLLKNADEESDDWLFQDRRKKKKNATASHNNTNTKPVSSPYSTTEHHATSNSASPNANRSIKHDIHRLACFEHVNVRAPITAGAVAATITVLKDKLEHFRSFIPAAETATAESSSLDIVEPSTTAEAKTPEEGDNKTKQDE